MKSGGSISIYVATFCAIIALSVREPEAVGASEFDPFITGIRSRIANPRSRQDLLRWGSKLQTQLLQEPNNAKLYELYGYVMWQQGRIAAAVRLFEQSLVITPTSTSARFGYAYLLCQLDRNFDALFEVNRLIKQDPKHAEAHALKGLLLVKIGRNGDGLQSLETAWQSRPASITAGLALARFDVGRGDLRSAVDRLRICLVLEPDNLAIRKYYAQMLIKIGLTDEALRQWQLVVCGGDSAPDGHFQLARIFCAKGDWQQAFDHLESGRQISPSHPSVAQIERLLGKQTRTPQGVADYQRLTRE